MNKGAWLFALFVGGYVLFEVTMLHRFAYRMEADHILQQMLSAEEAMKQCGEPSARQSNRFSARLEGLLQRAERERRDALADVSSDGEPGVTPAAGALQDTVAKLRSDAEARVRSEGCDSDASVTDLRRYLIYAGRD